MMLDACLMVHGSWLMAHGSSFGSWPREARGRLMAHGSWTGAGQTPGTQGQAPGPGPGPLALGSLGSGRPLAISHEPPLASLGHEP